MEDRSVPMTEGWGFDRNKRDRESEGRDEMGSLSVGVTGIDRRANRRYKYAAQASLGDGRGGEVETGRVVDVSAGGCLVELPAALTMKTLDQVELMLKSNFLALRANGSIQRSDLEGRLLGIRFTHLSQRGRLDLSELIDSLEHMRVAERDPRSLADGRR
jgi:hypothetical protein